MIRYLDTTCLITICLIIHWPLIIPYSQFTYILIRVVYFGRVVLRSLPEGIKIHVTKYFFMKRKIKQVTAVVLERHYT